MDAEQLYVSLLSNPAYLQPLRRLQYRCDQRRCLLLDAIDVPGEIGIVLHQKRYKYSPHENERRSNGAGRRANTFDGLNHWRERSYFIRESALAYPDDRPAPQIGLTCDHVLQYLLEAPVFHRDLGGGHAEVRVRADGTRYVVR